MKLIALQDVWINGGSTLIKQGEVFTVSCGNCAKSLIANKQAEVYNA